MADKKQRPKKEINTHGFTTLRMPVRPYYRQFLLGPKCRPYTKAIEQVASED